MQKILCRLKNVTKEFGKDGVCPIKNMNLVINRGDYVAIEGPSGIGKSTLLYLIGGLLRPSSGEVYFDGAKIETFSERQLVSIRRNKISYIFQEYRYVEVFTVQENLKFIARNRKVNSKSINSEIDYYLEQLGLQEKKDEYPCKLSGGQKRRLMIALALIKDSALIIADEPTNDLDHIMEDMTMRLFDEKIKEGKTIILSTHNPKISQRVNFRYQIVNSELVLKY